jgi:large subunit ribosomal protein L21
MYAIIDEGGGQRKLAQGDEFLTDLRDAGEAKAGSTIVFDKVLLVGDVGGGAKIGTPYVPGAKVTCEVVESLVKGEKIDVHHFREKKAWKKKTGHRQPYTKVKVTSITG